MMREPKTEPIPAPDPATPTVAAPAPMNLAAESMSLLTYNNGRYQKTFPFPFTIHTTINNGLCQKTFHIHSQCSLAKKSSPGWSGDT